MENREALYYEIGSYCSEITPPLSIPYLAGNPRHQFFTGVHDPIYISAVVVSDGDNEVALVTIDGTGISNDILGKDRDFASELKDRIEKSIGIKKDAVIFLSGHIHSTPDTTNFRPFHQYPAALPWLNTVMEQISSAIGIASRNKFRATLKIGKGNVEGITKNRRGTEFLDTEVIVLLFESLEKDQNIILVNYACHPVIVQVQELVSADYVGAMRDVLKKSLSDVKDVLFIQGACGDIDPKRGWTCNFRDVYLSGVMLAGEVMKVYSAMATPGYPTEPVSVASVSELIDLPSRRLPPREEITMLNAETEELQQKYQNSSSRSERDLIHEKLGPMDEAYWRIKEGSNPFKAELQLIRLGNGVLVGVPGEMMCKMGIDLKDFLKPLVAIPAGYANGYLGYIASKEDWERGGYEVELGPWSKVGPEAYDIIIKKIGSLKADI